VNRRRFLLTSLIGVLAVPTGAEAQQAGGPMRIGVLTPQSRETGTAVWESFRQGLRELGWEERRNLVIETRFADGKLQQLRGLAEQLLTLNVRLIVAAGSSGARAAIDATKTVPIVMVEVADPVATGFVTNLARPGGNVTGLTNMAWDLTQKRLQLLKEAVPGAARIAVIMHPGNPTIRRSGVRLNPRPTGSVFNSRDWRCEMLKTSAERSRRQ
jgi:ABC-type uncharacterized transport system substrate-binding protein